MSGILDAPAASPKAVGLSTKRAGVSLSNTQSLVNPAYNLNDWTQRPAARIPVNSTRWRLHVQNANSAFATLYAGVISFVGVWIGKQTYNASGSQLGQGANNHSAAPVQALSAFSTPSDGSAYTSAWVTSPTAQLQAFIEHLIDMGATCTPGTSIAGSVGPYHPFSIGSGKSAGAGTQTVAGISAAIGASGALDMWIEYEFVGTQPLYAVLGDSRSIDYTGATDPCPASLSWPHQLAMRTGSPVLNMSVAGIGGANFVTPSTANMLTKWGLGTSAGQIALDAVIIALGINDFGGLQSAAVTEPYIVGLFDWFRNVAGVKRIYACTVPPAGGTTLYTQAWVQGALTGASSVSANSFGTSVAYLAAQKFVIDYGLATEETLTVAAGGSTGSAGAYTTPTTTNAIYAHASGAGVVNVGEKYRADYNAWLRRNPAGVHGVVDLDLALRSPSNPLVLDTRYDSGDKLHFTRAADMLQANLAAAAINSRPLAA